MDRRFLILIFSIFLINACSEKETSEKKGKGYLTLKISQTAIIKTGIELNDFTLRISDGQVEVIKGIINDLPVQIELPVGIYTIEAYSAEFSEPKFDTPFYYGKTIVSIEPDVTKEAALVCSQGNAGVRVVWSKDFSDMYATYQAHISNDDGYLNYMSTETRTGYFLPGTVSILIMADGQNINGGAITLAAQDLVTAYLQVKNTKSGELTFNISIDNRVNERDIELIIDPDNIATLPNSETNPYTVTQAIERQGESSVWIKGYIVGSKPSSGYDFVSGAWQRTNIVIADNITETNDRNCIFVELGSSGIYRNNLNLLDNPEILHRTVSIKGNLVEYQSRPGLRNLAGYSFID